jgi:hypothetical protein
MHMHMYASPPLSEHELRLDSRSNMVDAMRYVLVCASDDLNAALCRFPVEIDPHVHR